MTVDIIHDFTECVDLMQHPYGNYIKFGIKYLTKIQ